MSLGMRVFVRGNRRRCTMYRVLANEGLVRERTFTGAASATGHPSSARQQALSGGALGHHRPPRRPHASVGCPQPRDQTGHHE